MPATSTQSDLPLRRPRVLHLSYSCAPGWGSEPGVGWNRAVEMANHCDVWVVCNEEDCRAWIEDYLAKHPDNPHLKFIYIPHERVDKLLTRLPGCFYVAYNRWHRRAYREICRLHQEINFDLVHQITFCGYREPSYLWKLGVPFVWGPVGGTQNYPWRFVSPVCGLKVLSEAFRSVLNTIQLRCSPRVKQAARSASAIFAANSTAASDIKSTTGVEVLKLLDIGLEPVNGPTTPVSRQAGPLRILWSGVLETRKALELLIEAVALLPEDVDCQVQVLGEGPAQTRWQRLAARRGVASRFQWTGRLPRDEAVAQLNDADVFVFTSLRDTAGTVLLEAMASGTPIISIDHQGAADIVDEKIGFKVAPTNRRDVSQQMSVIIARLARNPDLLESFSLAAKQMAADFTWSHQAQRISEVYDSIFESEGKDCRCAVPAKAQLPLLSVLDAVYEDQVGLGQSAT